MSRFSGRAALITGAGSGIGAAAATRLAADGAAVVFCARSEVAVQQLATSIEDAGGRALGLTADLADAGSTGQFLDAAQEFGSIDIVVNNVGNSPARNFQRLEDEDWSQLLELNLMAAVRCTRALLGGMRERGFGRVVMVSSLAARQPDAALVDYAAGKAALSAMAKALAGRYGRDGVLVNSVLPGLIHTPMWDRAAAEIAAATESDPESVIAGMARQVPLGRYGTAEEVASVIAFLCSDDASYVNGVAIEIDGGLSGSVY